MRWSNNDNCVSGPASVRLLLLELNRIYGREIIRVRRHLATDKRTSDEVFEDGTDRQGRGDDDRYILARQGSSVFVMGRVGPSTRLQRPPKP